MKTSRGISVVGLSAAVVAAGWVMGSDMFTPPQATGFASQPAASAATGTAAAPGSGASSTAAPAAEDPAPSVAAASGTFEGTAVGTRYGTFQAEITVSNGTITDVSLRQ